MIPPSSPNPRPESLLAAAAFGLFAAVAVLLAGSLVSCRSGGSPAGPGVAAGADRPVTPWDGSETTPITRVAGLTGEPEIRVHIIAGAQALTLDGPAAVVIAPVARGNAHPRHETDEAETPVEVIRALDGWRITDADGDTLVFDADADLQFTSDGRPKKRERAKKGRGANDDAAPTSLLTINGVPYHGRIRLTARSDASPTAFDAVEYLPLETYLPGVVAKELYQTWPLAAYQVQAICARSYALHERQRGLAAKRAFDVESTTRDQAYAGATVLPVALEAVRSTRGVVLTYGNALLRTYYSSTCGGRTASARDTWPTTAGYEYNLAPPIQGHPRDHACTASPLFTWSVERDRADLVRRLRAYGEKHGFLVRKLTDLAGVQVARTNGTGRPAEYKIMEPGGKWYTLKAEDLRLACNFDPAPPNAPASAATSVKPAAAASRPKSAPGAPSTGAYVPAFASSVTPASVPTPAEPEPTQPGAQRPPAGTPITRQNRVNSGDLEFSVKGASVTITGRGFGHGVGMCQYCAKAMADRGDSPRAMLERFYPAAAIVRAY